MKRILILAALALSACAPSLSTVVDTAPSVAAALGAPHLTLSGLTVTVHNPTRQPLGPAVVTVEGRDVMPGEGTSCTPEAEAAPLPRWNCRVEVPGSEARDVPFVAAGAAPGLKRAFGTGYLGGSAVPVPLALAR